MYERNAIYAGLRLLSTSLEQQSPRYGLRAYFTYVREIANHPEFDFPIRRPRRAPWRNNCRKCLRCVHHDLSYLTQLLKSRDRRMKQEQDLIRFIHCFTVVDPQLRQEKCG